MKLELPDNNASVLFHMGNALQSIAKDLDLERVDKLASHIHSGHKVTHTETVGDVSHSVTVEPLMVMATGDKNPINTDASERRYLDESEPSDTVGDITKDIAAEHDRLLGASDTIDADGLPWDQRIHSRGKTRIADNTWRTARKPNDKTDEEWAEYVEGVKTELRALMAIPVATGAELDVLANIPVATAEQPVELVTPPVVDATDVNGVEFRQLSGEIHNVEINGTLEFPPIVDSATFEAVANGNIGAGQPVRVVTPPVVDAVVTPPVVDAVVTPPVVDAVVTPPVIDAVVTPPVIDAVVTPPPADFGALMRFITANKAKLTSQVVDDVLAGQGLASLALLATRPELIPQFHTALVKLL